MNLGGTVKINKVGVGIVTISFLLLFIYIFIGHSDDTSSKILAAPDEENRVNMKALLVAAKEVAEKGGQQVKVAKKEASDLHIKSKGKTKEGVNDPVTDADFRSHCVMYHGLKKKFPTLKVISEEHDTSECKNATPSLDVVGMDGQSLPDLMVANEDVTIWIDPLDATKEFTENLLQYVTTMVCVAVKGRPIIGVIHFPFAEPPVTYWSWGNVAKSDSITKLGSHKSNLEAPSITVSMSHTGGAQKMAEVAFGKKAKVIPAAGAGYKVMEVVKGNADIYLHSTIIKKWDVCAGNAILHSLSGSMTDLKGNKLDYSSEEQAVNKDGILAVLTDADLFLEKIANPSLN
ncbi:putative inositol monophosphatase 3 [Neocloeon triangulifer]|uniref:putative inositol monophosphatase 3 n=1 Tax=Neocloeon triangulifer TaxID=2078957 RepID=UPI00286F4BD4|nr:putative inositol monophosphatase 3 [Neocloeon triangulifer]